MRLYKIISISGRIRHIKYPYNGFYSVQRAKMYFTKITFFYTLWRFIPLKFDSTMCIRTYTHINKCTNISITVKAVGIKYKNATNLQYLLSLKWAIWFQLKNKNAVFLLIFFFFSLKKCNDPYHGHSLVNSYPL